MPEKIAIPKGKVQKVSKFKSERQKQSNTTPLIVGDVIEGKKSLQRDIVTCGSHGFPTIPHQRLSLGIKREESKSEQSSIASASTVSASTASASTVPTDQNGSTKDDDDYKTENLKQVMCMSESEIENSIRELSTIFSAESLEFLKARGASGPEVPPPSDNSATTNDSNVKNVMIKEASSAPRTEEELMAAIRSAPESVRQALAWTVNEEDDSTTVGSTPRFDLEGRRIVGGREDLGEECRHVMASSFLSRILPTNSLHEVALLCADAALCSGFAVEEAGLGTLRELSHHQAEQGRPGYSLHEACELLRSEVPSQRLAGGRIVIGVMWRRDVATSVETYCHTSVSKCDDNSATLSDRFCTAYAQLVREVCSRVETARPVCANPERAFLMRKDVARLAAFVLLRSCCAHDYPPELASILTRFAVISCGSALSHTRSALHELMALRSLQCFLSCKLEFRAGDMMWGIELTRPPPLSDPHTRRHERSYAEHIASCSDNATKAKADITHNASLSESRDLPEDAAWMGAARTPQEEFALLCRWSRAEGLFTEGTWGVSGAIGSSVEGALQALLGIELGGEISLDPNSPVVTAVEIGTVALDVLTAALRGSIDYRVSEAVFNHALEKMWPSAVRICSRSFPRARGGEWAHTFSAALWKFIAEMCRSGVKYAEWMCDRGLLEAGVAVVGQQLSLKGSEMCSQAESANMWYLDSFFDGTNTPLAWVLRCFRCCAAYGVALHCLTELVAVLRSRTNLTLGKNQSQSGFQVTMAKWFPVDWPLYLRSELMLMLEEAAVHCSVEFLNISQYSAEEIVLLSSDTKILAVISLTRVLFDISRDTIECILVSGKEASRQDAHWNIRFSAVCMDFISSIVGFYGGDFCGTAEQNSLRDLLLASCIKGPGLLYAVDKFCSLSFSHSEALSPEIGLCMAQSQEFKKAITQELSDCLLVNKVDATNDNDSFHGCICIHHALSVRRLALCVSHMVSTPNYSVMVMSDITHFLQYVLKINSVAGGLFLHRCVEIQHSALMITLQFAATYVFNSENDSVRSEFAATVSSVLPYLCGAFPITAKKLLALTMNYFVSSCLPSEVVTTDAVQEAVNLIMRDIKEDGHALDTLNTCRFSGFIEADNYRSETQSTSMTVLHNSRNRPHLAYTSPIVVSIKPVWMFECLVRLRGGALALWLRVLARSGIEKGIFDDRLGHVLLYLCRLAVSDVDDSKDSSAGLSADPLSDEVDSFIFLIEESLVGLWKRRGRGYGNYASQFISVAAEYASQSDSSQWKSAGRGGKLREWEQTESEYTRTSELSGARELVVRLVNALCEQTYTDGRINTAALLPVLVSGFLPQTLKARVWKELGTLRLLHMAEDRDMLKKLLPLFLPSSTDAVSSDGSLEGVILTAIMSLRCYKKDRHMLIYLIGLYSIAWFIFTGVAGKKSINSDNALTGARARLFRRAVENVDDAASVRCTAVDLLICYSVLTNTEQLLCTQFEGEVPDLTCTSKSILDVWAAAGLYLDNFEEDCDESRSCVIASELWTLKIDCGNNTVMSVEEYISKYRPNLCAIVHK